MNLTALEFIRGSFKDTADGLDALLPAWPLLNVIHCIVTAIALRKEPGGHQFTMQHPIASCVANVILSMSGGIITSLLLGKPLLHSVTDERVVWCSIAVWYLINFSPNDIAFNILQIHFVKYIVNILEEIYRSKKVMSGVLMGASVYPKSLLAQGLSGMFKSSGKKWNITLYRLLIKSDLTSQHELLSPAFTTKAGFLLGVFYGLSHMYNLFGLSDNECIMIGAVLLGSLQFWELWHKVKTDPLKKVQESLWGAIHYRQMGGGAGDETTVEEREEKFSNEEKKEQ